MSRNAVETVMGAVVLVVAAVFLFFAYTTSKVNPVSGGYVITAQFDRVDGLRDGGDVRISGIKVGTVVSQSLDPKTFLAVVRMNIESSIKLPVDTIATISSTGLLGDNYLALVPGNEEETIKPGGTIEHTEPAVNVMSLINKYIGGGIQQQSQQQQSGNGKSAPPK